MEGSAVGIFANEPWSSTVARRMAARTLPLMSPEPSGLLLLCWFFVSPASVGMALQSELLEYEMWFWFTFVAALEERQGLSAFDS